LAIDRDGDELVAGRSASKALCVGRAAPNVDEPLDRDNLADDRVVVAKATAHERSGRCVDGAEQVEAISEDEHLGVSKEMATARRDGREEVVIVPKSDRLVADKVDRIEHDGEAHVLVARAAGRRARSRVRIRGRGAHDDAGVGLEHRRGRDPIAKAASSREREPVEAREEEAAHCDRARLEERAADGLDRGERLWVEGVL